MTYDVIMKTGHERRWYRHFRDFMGKVWEKETLKIQNKCQKSIKTRQIPSLVTDMDSIGIFHLQRLGRRCHHHLFLLKLFCVYKIINFFSSETFKFFTFCKTGIGLENVVVYLLTLKYAIEKN